MTEKKDIRETAHYIVAIGASAGGLEAINSFFDAVQDFSQLSFVIIQHLSPDYKSLLVELVSKHTQMKVLEARDNMAVERAAIYVIPNRMSMTIHNGTLCLAEKVVNNVPNNAIDIFLDSLANDQQERAIAVILSGTGSDGTRGIQAIKKNKGYVLVQEPNTAKFDGMPNMAIMSGYADAILPPKEMPQQMLDYIQLMNGEDEALSGELNDQQVDRILALVHENSDRDFNYYKTPTIIRRISRRIRLQQIKSVQKYIEFLEGNADEVHSLANDLLINVTRFFRDPEAFRYLEEQVYPSLVKQKATGETFKIWVCACSTGEEAYSLAISLDQYLQQTATRLPVKIFATDVDESNIRLASRNRYPLSIEKDVPSSILKRYFTLEDNHYAVIPRIRKQVVFAHHNVIKDPAFIKNDLISCRNMLIYMNKVLQEKILSIFHFALKPGGALFLGPSETTGALENGFEQISGKWKIFKRSPHQLKKYLGEYGNALGTVSTSYVPRKATESLSVGESLRRDFQQLMLDELGYTVIYIDGYNEVKETLGNYHNYLSLPKKKLNLNILSMVPEEVKLPLSNAIRESRQEGIKVSLTGLSFRKDDQINHVNIHIHPAAPPHEHLSMLVFIDVTIPLREHEPLSTFSLHSDSPDEKRYIQELEDQLNETRNNLQLAIEGLETTNEELQSSNEELLSSNEELQSSNEELQSLNEELHTLNTEHQLKIKELIELNDDLDNYFKSTENGQVFLDKDLKIRKFNPQAMRLINLIEGDIGRPIGHISNNLANDNLLEDIKKAQSDKGFYEKEVQLQDSRIYLMRIYPFVRRDKEIDGLVLSFIDISALENLNSIIKAVFDASLEAIFVLTVNNDASNSDQQFVLLTQNEAGANLLDRLAIRKDHPSFFGHLTKRLGQRVSKKLLDTYTSGTARKIACNLQIDNREQWFEISMVKMRDGLALTFNDITLQRETTDRLRKNYNELVVTREQLKNLNSGLEDEVAKRTAELALSEERFRLVARATNDCIRDWDLVHNTVWYSDNFYSIFAYSSDEQVQTINQWFSKIHPDDVKVVRKDLLRAINQGAEQWSGEYRFHKGDGSYCYVFDRSFILNNESGMPFRVISSLMDVSTLKEAELATRELATKKDEFMSIASHELKTPITSMKASLQLIDRLAEKGGPNGMLKTFVAKANQQVDKITFLIENLLDVTKIQAGKIILQKSTFNINELIQDCVYEVKNMGGHTIQIHGNIDVDVYADKNRIEQVLINFLTNAIKYSPKADKVDLFTERNESEVKISVKDYGIGIPQEKLDLVFDRFFRVEESSSQFSGLGLGLFISSDIIKRHQGQIGAVSSPGEGSTFWFSLPIQQA
ncbi:ATP-binding protein [Olivibacter sp. SA151]|uniref:chemotaxis protein CheB n=1 Tax=Olivibacter jilunii TaxID=985016 RepID=UPI003F17FA54